MRRHLIAITIIVAAPPGYAQDEACRAATRQRAEACAETCVAKARAAVDPSVQNRIIGRACVKNCLKIQMFQGQTCP